MKKQLLLCIFSILGFLSILATQLTHHEIADTFFIFFAISMAEAVLTVAFDKKGKWTDPTFFHITIYFYDFGNCDLHSTFGYNINKKHPEGCFFSLSTS